MILTALTSSLRKLIYLSLGSFDRCFNRQTKLYVLCYHGIATDGWRFNIDQKTFSQQMKWLQAHYQIISLAELESYLKNNTEPTNPTVLITFDDGYQNLLEITPLLQELKITPTLFVLSEIEQANRLELGSNEALLTTSQLKKLVKNGWDIGCHSATHPDFKSLSLTEIQREISKAKLTLEKKIGQAVTSFAYPKGKHTAPIISEVEKAGFITAFTMDDGQYNDSINRLKLPRIGVDKTHSMAEFKVLMSPLNIAFRRLLKTSIIGNYIV